ncbi:MAG: hypothetical protein PHG20_13455, partial [Geobacteraceae bacterium]|nr:hypothetical protein [Geobacteraceae bacterium]
MRISKIFLSYGTVLALFVLAFPKPISAEDLTPPKNIILFIGDGMGMGHITAAKIESEKLNLEQFKILGLLAT